MICRKFAGSRISLLLFAVAAFVFQPLGNAQASGVAENQKSRISAGAMCTKHGAACSVGSFCKLEAGTCKKKAAKGSCEVKPDMCMKLYKPVCGCDGKTYGNECMADAAGVSVKSEGKCGKKVKKAATTAPKKVEFFEKQ